MVVKNTARLFSAACTVTSVGFSFIRVKVSKGSASKKQEEKKAFFAKEHKCACLALDKEESVIGYVVPVCKSRWLSFLFFPFLF